MLLEALVGGTLGGVLLARSAAEARPCTRATRRRRGVQRLGVLPLVLTVLGAAPLAGPAHGQASEPALEVRDVRVDAIGGGRRVRITLTRAPEGVRGARLDEPLRLEIDVDGPGTGGAEKRFPIKDELVAGVRVAPRAGGLSVMIDLKRDPGPSEVRAEGTEVIAELGERYVTRPALGVDLEGKRLKISGRWAERRLEASRVEHKHSRKDPRTGRVDGPITAVGPEPRTF